MEIIDKIKKILTDPINFFQGLKKETGIRDSFLYLVILSFVSLVLGFIVGLMTEDYTYSVLSKFLGSAIEKPQYTMAMRIIFAFLVYGLGLLISFVAAGILHVWILIFGGREPYSKTYQLSVYSRTPSYLFGWIPFLNFFTWIYDLVLLIIGTQKIHNIPRTKSILMYVIPIVVIGIFVVFIMFFALAMMKNQGLFGNFNVQ